MSSKKAETVSASCLGASSPFLPLAVKARTGFLTVPQVIRAADKAHRRCRVLDLSLEPSTDRNRMRQCTKHSEVMWVEKELFS